MDDFKEILLLAKSGENDAIELIIEMYKLPIHKRSFVDNTYDEDLKQILVHELLKCIKKFKI